MALTWRHVAFSTGTFLLGALLAVFLVFNGLFSDGPDPFHAERWFLYGMTAGAYALATLGMAWCNPRWSTPPTRAATWLPLLFGPAVIILLLYQEPPGVLSGMTALSVLVGGMAAGGLRAAWSRRSPA